MTLTSVGNRGLLADQTKLMSDPPKDKAHNSLYKRQEVMGQFEVLGFPKRVSGLKGIK
jgi:hypothetical protein